MKMLIVARSAGLKKMVLKTLDREGIAVQITACTQADRALDLYGEHKPDWVLMDLDLTGGNGLQAADRLITAWPCARVVFLTDYDDSEYLAGMRASGGKAYLLKEHIHRLPETLRRMDATALAG
ncbi:MAG: response regulator [Acidobacteriota bacterium]|nr:response regulator [Acidobacteriota bacterium]